jgi:hypothetical protein
VALACPPSGGYRAAGLLEPSGGAVTGGLSQRRPLLGAADEAFARLLTDEGLQAWVS